MLFDLKKEAGRLWGAEFLKMAENFSMFKRLGRAEEVADIVAFVASPAASWITGECRSLNFCCLTNRTDCIAKATRYLRTVVRFQCYKAKKHLNLRLVCHQDRSADQP